MRVIPRLGAASCYREVYRQSLAWIRIARVFYGRHHTLLGFLHRRVQQTDDIYPWQTLDGVHFNLHNNTLKADHCTGEYASKHEYLCIDLMDKCQFLK